MAYKAWHRIPFAILCHLPLAASRNFENWFPGWYTGLDILVKGDCKWAYDYYVKGSNPYCVQKSDSSCTAGLVVDCMLENLKESWKANMAAGAVVLGLLPTILALAGSSTVELGLLFFRRPILAFLLGIGTPAIMPIRTFDYRDPAEILHKRQDQVVEPKLSKTIAHNIIALQYILTLGALANIAHITWQLSTMTVVSFAPATQFLPSIWVGLGIVIHLFGTAAVMLRAKLTLCDAAGAGKTAKQVFQEELSLCARQPKARLTLRAETYKFILFSWVTSMLTIIHIILGTLIFSSMLLVGGGGAVIVAGRLLVSTAVCRIILMFELSGMRKVIET